MEKKIIPTLVTRFGNKGKTRMAWILAGLLFLGACPLIAAETVKKESVLQQKLSLEKRGLVNLVTSPGEVVNAFKTEKKDHPKTWTLTYIPRLFMNFFVRVGSSANDFIVSPWYSSPSDAIPLTRRFDLPDYVWEKE